VNEGVWFQDNASLTKYDPATGSAVQDYFAFANPGRRLGDLGNDIVIWKSRAYITVTTSQTIEVLELPSGRSLGRIILPAGSDPRSVVIVDDSTGFVTNLKDDSVVEIDPTALTLGRRIAVGPSPEGIAAVDSLIYVANSGYGILRQEEPGAGTLSVIDIRTGVVRDTVRIGENPQSVRYLRSTRTLYVLYGLPESPGGVAELDPNTLQVGRRWPIDGTRDQIAVDSAHGILYAIGTEGIWRIDPTAAGSSPTLLLASRGYTDLGFYAVGLAPLGDLYIGYTRGFTIPGSALVVDRQGNVTATFATGLNPGAFGSY
jgi:DNA-binding beta-propeller fold protein YncE